MRRKIFPNLQRFVWRRHAGGHLGLASGYRHKHQSSVKVFCYENVNLSLEGLKNTKISHFLTNMAALTLGRHVEIPRHAKALRFKHSLSQNQEVIRSENLYE